MRFVVAALAAAVVVVGVGCPKKPSISLDDAGTSLGGEGEGEGEGEGRAGEGEGEGHANDNRGTACTLPAGSECDPGLLCVSEVFDKTAGTCRKPCATISGGQAGPDDPSVCTPGETCQQIVFFDGTQNQFAGLQPVCLPQVTDANAPCFAFDDTDACSDGRICDVVDLAFQDPTDTTNKNIRLVTECKDRCSLGAVNADNACPAGETCGRPIVPLLLDAFQPGGTGADGHVACDFNACETSDICPCQRANGFECVELTGGTASCARFIGYCGVPVENLTPADAATRPPTSECDDSKAEMCDDRPYRSATNHAQETCVRGAAADSTSPNAGFCAAVCDQPQDDYDGDGTISQGANGPLGLGEQRISAPCPSGQVCGYDVSAAMFWVSFNSSFATCDTSICPPSDFCPTCSPQERCAPEAFAGDPNNGFCAIVIGTCEEPPAGEGEGEGSAGEGEGEGASGEGEGEGALGEGEGEGASGEGEGEGASGEGEGEGASGEGEGEGASGEGEGEGGGVDAGIVDAGVDAGP